MAERREIHDGGRLLYEAAFFPREEADALFVSLRDDIPWRQEAVGGRPLPRLNAWFADAGLTYRYSGLTHHGSGWPPGLVSLRRRIEDTSGAAFNSLLLNRYRDGTDSIGFHTDAEPELGSNPVVATASFGAEREFVLKHKRTRETLVYRLGHGSLLVMGGTSQHHWLHAVPKAPDAVGGRISLTFRRIVSADPDGGRS
jgi:alkylated DNA repair dioxygenase AlkB